MGKHWMSLKNLRDIKNKKNGFKRVSIIKGDKTKIIPIIEVLLKKDLQ